MIITSIFEQMPKKYQLWVFNSKDSVEKMSE